ncbi:hypothetical protein [Vibrio breoganii]|uniref:hypothetical protein n=1 Tax=Vibrio breoganii TaxID=553239 RepID=UPI0021C3069A|nr:hypothetical protein [Vibrio breoganii]MDN3717775.1 hypothetical protein [Vibrio breoganii]
MRNELGAWGGSTPSILVLVFSKGITQANIDQSGRFEDVAFGGATRNRLDKILKKLGILRNEEHVSEHTENPNAKLALGSLVRCSLTRKDSEGQYSSSGPLVIKSFNKDKRVELFKTVQYILNVQLNSSCIT